MTQRLTTAAMAILASAAAACGGEVTVANGSDVAARSRPTTTATNVRAQPTPGAISTPEPIEVIRVHVELPAIAPIALPDLTQLNATGDIVAAQLGELSAATEGLDVIGATCVADGGELAYAGTTESGLFSTSPDGSGTYFSENETDLVTLDVARNGAGEYYDRDSDGLLTIKVADDGSGEYYNDRDGALTTVRVDGDGNGEYYRSDAALVTISIDASGRGEYFSQSAEGRVTVLAAPDGVGEYYDDRDGLETIDVKSNGSWTYVRDLEGTRIELNIKPNGSGHFRRTGTDPITLSIGPGGTVDGVDFEVPDAPTFLVAAEFPPLGTLSTLAPTCATIIRFDEQVLFDYDSAALSEDSAGLLNEVVSALNELGRAIEIAGHTDSHGTDAYNLELSRQRAEAVFAALDDRGLSVEANVVGYGETRPLESNETADGQDSPLGRESNRRVEIVIPEP